MAARLLSALSCGVARNVCGCVSGSLLFRLLKNVPNSSCSNCCSVSRGPCSRTTTVNPAVESSFARTPPAAPDPTITKSTMSLGRKRTAGRRVSCSMSASPVRFGIVEAERRLETRLMLEPDKVPTGVVFVAAPFRQREGSDNGVEAHRLEELALLDRLQHVNLLFDAQRSKRGDAGLLRSCACIQVSDAID